MKTGALFSSEKQDWETPQALFDRLNRIFSFQLDVAASESNAKCNQYYTKHDDGLKQPWFDRNWMNPPYGREIGKWCKKADEHAQHSGGGNRGIASRKSGYRMVSRLLRSLALRFPEREIEVFRRTKFSPVPKYDRLLWNRIIGDIS